MIAAVVTTISTITVLLAASRLLIIIVTPARVYADAFVGKLVIISTASLWAAWRAGIFITAWRRRSCVTVVANLNPFGSFVGVLLLALLCPITPAVNERGLPLTVALCAPPDERCDLWSVVAAHPPPA